MPPPLRFICAFLMLIFRRDDTLMLHCDFTPPPERVIRQMRQFSDGASRPRQPRFRCHVFFIFTIPHSRLITEFSRRHDALVTTMPAAASLSACRFSQCPPAAASARFSCRCRLFSSTLIAYALRRAFFFFITPSFFILDAADVSLIISMPVFISKIECLYARCLIIASPDAITHVDVDTPRKPTRRRRCRRLPI